MTALSRAASVIGVMAIGYGAIVVESMLASPTLLPHLPLALLTAAIWSIGASPAICVGGLVGLGCDVLGWGPIGPGIVAGSLTAFLCHAVRRHGELDSVAALILLAAAIVGLTLAGEAATAAVVTRQPVDWRLAGTVIAGRATTTALLAGGLLIAARSVRRLQRLATSL